MRDAGGGDQRRFLGRLGDHRIAGGERRGDLAGEDRQREIPRADADDGAERPVRGVVAVGRDLGRRNSAGNRLPRALRAMAFGSDLPASRTISADELGARALRSRSAARAQACGALGGGVAAQSGARGSAPAQRAVDVAAVGASRPCRRSSRSVGGVDAACAGCRCRRRRRAAARRASASASAGVKRRVELAQARASSARSRPRELRRAAPNSVARQRDARMRRAGRRDRRASCDRIGDQRLDATRCVGDAVDEGGVGAVLQQAAHQIGEQRLVRADRRVDAAGPVELVRARRPRRRAASPMPCRHWNS